MYYNDYNRVHEEDPIITNNFRVDGAEAAPGKRKKNAGVKIAALCLACALVGGAVGGAAVHFLPGGGQTTLYEGTHTPVAVTMSSTSTDQVLTIPQIYANNVGSTVGITTELVTTNFWGQPVKSAAAGSGFVVTQDGYILTNYHVIAGASSIKVAFVDGTTYDAALVGGEEANDIAVLKIEAAGLTPVTLGDSDKLVVGESVYTIGNPLGELTYSLTDGIISALDRLISTGDNVTLNMLQTNCDINPGNSGGPLFDSYGSVIGITTAKYTQSSSGVSAEGLGFAIPINDVKDILSDLIEHGYVTGKPYMGVQVNTVSSEAQRYGIPAGAAVEYVAEGSCAQKAGLQTGDIITAIDDTAIDSPSALTAALSSNYKAGDTATLTVIRSQQEMKLTITFDEKNAETEANNQIQQDTQQQQQQSQNGYYYQWPFGSFRW